MAVISTKSEYDKIRDETDRLTEIFRKNEEKKREEEKLKLTANEKLEKKQKLIKNIIYGIIGLIVLIIVIIIPTLK